MNVWSCSIRRAYTAYMTYKESTNNTRLGVKRESWGLSTREYTRQASLR